MSLILYDLVGKNPEIPFGPHCWKAKMALAHKGLNYEAVPVKFTEIPTLDDGAYSTLPAINHNGEKIKDSFEFAEYLRTRYPDVGQRLFKGDGGLATSRFIEAWCLTALQTWIGGYAIMDIFNMLDEADQVYFRESREARIGKKLEEVIEGREERVEDLLKNRLLPLRILLKKQDFIGGKQPLYADYIVFGTFQWLRVSSGLHMIPDDDPVKAWINRCLALHDGLAGKVPEAFS